MEEKIKELTLMLLYMTSWEERDEFGIFHRSWKGYPFEVLNEFKDKDYIRGSTRARSVYVTKEGIKEAEKLLQKYFGDRKV